MADKGGVKLTALPGNVYQLTLTGNNEHRFNPTLFAAINLALDEVEKDPNAGALVTTNEGKFFSNGLDLALFMKDPSLYEVTVDTLQRLLKRLLTFPIPVIAAVCGHAVAGGCMLALAHDYQYMSAERGFIFLSEIDVKLPLTPGMNAIIAAKIHGKAFYKAVLAGHRFNAKSAAEHGFIDGALPDNASTLDAAIKHATALAAKKYHRPTYKALKTEMFKGVIKKLDEGGNPTNVHDFLARL